MFITRKAYLVIRVIVRGHVVIIQKNYRGYKVRQKYYLLKKAKASIMHMFIGWILTCKMLVGIMNSNPDSKYKTYVAAKRTAAIKKIIYYWLKINWRILVYNDLLRKNMIIKSRTLSTICSQCHTKANELRQERSYRRNNVFLLAHNVKRIRCYIIYKCISLIITLRAFVHTKRTIYLNNMANKIQKKYRWHILPLSEKDQR